MRCLGRAAFFGAAVRAFAFTALRAEDRAGALALLRFFTAVLVAGLDAFCLAIVCLPDPGRARTGATRPQTIQSWTGQQLRGLGAANVVTRPVVACPGLSCRKAPVSYSFPRRLNLAGRFWGIDS